MKTVRDACILQDNALDIHVSDQIEQLEELIADEADGRKFFEKTHITDGMQTLMQEGINRLAGKSSQSSFHLKQAMGGGKTHLLVGFGLLAKHPNLRKTYCIDIPNSDEFDVARVAAFTGRNHPEHYFWGEVAEQLGKPAAFKKFWANGPKAPDENDWLALFEGDQPVLILLDEMPPYFNYYDTQAIGNGTIADIATCAFANMLTAASKKAKVCIVVSDLAASYGSGTRLINKALEDARQEIGRQERNITPVDLTGDEVYAILRKRLFKKLPDRKEIEDIAARFGRALEEATKSKAVNRGAEAISEEIINTYPFHPSLKNIVALFKENEKFKQTRGLMEIVSRLLRSVWERPANDIYLMGAQNFDLSITDVRDKLTEISGLRDAITKDLWDSNMSSHAQVIGLNTGNDFAAQVGTLVLTASLSTATNAIKGLNKEELLECLVNPVNGPNDYADAFDALKKVAWYMHRTPEEKFYFDRQENLTQLLESLAEDAPENKIDELITTRLKDMFAPTRGTAYTEVLPLPKYDEIGDKIRRSRVLLIISPDSKIPPEKLQEQFDSLLQKNNFCVLTGQKTQMASLEKAARQVYAVKKAAGRIHKEHPQRAELDEKIEIYEQDYNSTVLTIFDKVLFPVHLPGKSPELRPKPLDMTRDQKKDFSGEEQIEKTLTKDPLKLYLDIEASYDAIRDKAEDLLWPVSQDEARWEDMRDRFAEQAGMPWLPPKGLERLKTIACSHGHWEDLNNGSITKKPKKKTTSVQPIPESEPDDFGKVRIRVNPLNAGPAPRIHYSTDGNVSESSPVLTEQILETNALRVHFLVVDPSEQYETGEPVTWKNKLKIRNELHDTKPQRTVELLIAPKGNIKYTLDGKEPRDGIPYTGAFEIPDTETLVMVFAEADGLEIKTSFSFTAVGDTGIKIDDTKAGRLVNHRGGKRLDSRSKTFSGLKDAKEKNVTFEGIRLEIGQGSQSVSTVIGDIQVIPDYIENILNAILKEFDESTPITMTFKKANFNSGHDLKQFTENLGIEIAQEEIEQ